MGSGESGGRSRGEQEACGSGGTGRPGDKASLEEFQGGTFQLSGRACEVLPVWVAQRGRWRSVLCLLKVLPSASWASQPAVCLHRGWERTQAALTLGMPSREALSGASCALRPGCPELRCKGKQHSPRGAHGRVALVAFDLHVPLSLCGFGNYKVITSCKCFKRCTRKVKVLPRSEVRGPLFSHWPSCLDLMPPVMGAEQSPGLSAVNNVKPPPPRVSFASCAVSCSTDHEVICE